MIWFIFLGLCVAGFAFAYWRRDSDMKFTFVAVGVFVAVFAIFFSLIAGKGGEYNSYTKVKTQNLIALKDNSAIHGEFFLGIGTVDEKVQYSFYYEEEPGVYMLKNLTANEVTLAYTKGKQTPRLETRSECSRPGPWLLPGFDGCGYTTYRLVIPDGTIKSNFVLDAQ